MKKHVLITLFTVMFLSVFAQKATTSLKIGESILEISVLKGADEYAYSFSQADNSSSNPSYSSESFKRETLLTFVKSAYKDINKDLPKTASASIDSQIDLAFIELVAIMLNEDSEAPVIAKLKLKDSIPVYTESDNVLSHYLFPSNCYLVFKDGFIEQFRVYGKVESSGKDTATEQNQEVSNTFEIVDGENYGFMNIYSIGISSLKDRKKLYDVNIFIENSSDGKAGKIILGQCIEYNINPSMGTRDYSPSNSKVELTAGQEINLYKDSNAKLLEFKVFTDVVGFAEDTPNGLVQLELEKRIPINTRRKQFLWTGFNSGYSTVSYLDIMYRQSKIENKEKYLRLDEYTPPSHDTTVFYLNALQVHRYQIFEIGLKANLLFVEIQRLKSDFEINGFGKFGYSKVKDTISMNSEMVNVNETINSIILGGEAKITFYPEKRINLSASVRISNHYFLFDDYLVLKKEEIKNNPLVNPEEITNHEWFNTFSLDAYYWPSENGKIFVRYSFTSELDNFYSNFSQFQIGYSMFINTSKKN